MKLNTQEMELVLMTNKSHSKALSMLFISIFLVASLIPMLYIWGKPDKTKSRRKSEESVDIDLYHDFNCKMKIKSINWGEITSGGNSIAIIYIKNRSKTPLTLSCALANFSPPVASDHLSLDWDREGYLLNGHKTIKAQLILSVSDSNTFDVFNVDVLVTGAA
jgi:hypothetical protein